MHERHAQEQLSLGLMNLGANAIDVKNTPVAGHGHLMPKGDELNFQGGTTSNTEGEQGNGGRKSRDHAHDVIVPTQRSLFFTTDLEF